MEKTVFRFAPSPNGALHLGHAYSALLNDELARQAKGQFLLRIENIDIARCTSKLEKSMLNDLKWLGLQWPSPPMRQSERFSLYKQALEHLKNQGLIYPAFLTRKEIKELTSQNPNHPKDPDGAVHYPGDEKNWPAKELEKELKSGKAYSWRLDMKKALQIYNIKAADKWGDIIIARKDVPASYHLSVVVDDAAQNITHIVRGKDLEAATPLHLLLQKILQFHNPHYFHHRLILDEKGEKLSKSENAQALSVLRDNGKTLNNIKSLIQFSQEEAAHIFSQII